jgi:CheY-like chemotaxis protein
MSSATSIDLPPRSRPSLRLVGSVGADRHSRRVRAEELAAAAPRTPLGQEPGGTASVLVVGDDPERRAEMLSELRGLLPEGTPFEEAAETWQTIARAAGTRMVVLTGDLGDISAQGLMRVLSRRYPLLPVIAIGAHSRAAAAGAFVA